MSEEVDSSKPSPDSEMKKPFRLEDKGPLTAEEWNRAMERVARAEDARHRRIAEEISKHAVRKEQK